MNLIQEEIEKSEPMMLELIEGIELVKLSTDNVAKVYAMIKNDSAYRKASDTGAAPDEKTKYNGSTAYWMTQIRPFLRKEKSRNEEYNNAIKNVVISIDRENSTHLDADRIGRNEITERLLDLAPSDLLKYLKSPGTDFELIKILSEKTHPNGLSSKGKPYLPRTNLSFASKFCHFACFYIFEGEKEQDNYPIYDNVLKKALPKYLDYYKIKSVYLNDYDCYRKAIDDIIYASKAEISRNGFDQLLWYYYKGRI